MTVERKIALFGINRLSVSKPALPKSHEALVSSFLSPRQRDVIVRSETQLRVLDMYDNGDIHDRTLSEEEINSEPIDNADDGILGKVFRITYQYRPSEALT